MSILDEKDAVILTKLAQVEVLPKAEREGILHDASPRAQRIGRFLIDPIRLSPLRIVVSPGHFRCGHTATANMFVDARRHKRLAKLHSEKVLRMGGIRFRSVSF